MALQTNKIIARATAANGPIAYTLNVDGAFVLESVRLHLSAAGGAVENFVVANNAGAGAVYDVVLSTTNMNAVADVHYLPDRPIVFWGYVTYPVIGLARDVLTITYANTNNRAWGLEVIYRQGM